MTNVKANFKYMHDNIIECNLCCEGIPQTDAHLLDCATIIDNCPSLADNFDAEYEDIFGDVQKQLGITRIFKEVFDVKFSLDEQIS